MGRLYGLETTPLLAVELGVRSEASRVCTCRTVIELPNSVWGSEFPLGTAGGMKGHAGQDSGRQDFPGDSTPIPDF
jgi:hypothetical protein